MKKTLLFLLAFLPICLFAENVSLEQARKIAEDFLQRRLSRSSSVSLRMVYDGETQNSRSMGTPPALYVFDNTHQPGFVIVSGDDAAYPVLGYSYESDFPEGPLPANTLKGINIVIKRIVVRIIDIDFFIQHPSEQDSNQWYYDTLFI